MPYVQVNGIRLHYLDQGAGPAVVLIAGSASSAAVWRTHQIPALVAAGYRAIAYDSRGIPPTDECADGFTMDDLVADLAALVNVLGLGQIRVVGTSLGARVAQEFALAHPNLVRQAVLIASRARADTMGKALSIAENELADSGIELPVRYRAAVLAMQMLSPSTLEDGQVVADWLDLLELASLAGKGIRAQLALEPMPDRRAAYGGVTVPCHVISFEHDLITPPRGGRELAAAVPGATFELIGDAGHYGCLEQPEAVNKSVLGFLTP
jgi:pimeloyl-ACP methyl ester carboxylesterase